MTGVFVPWSKRKDSPGWITDANGCDIWRGCRNGSGYGLVRINGRTRSLNRVRYECEVGPIPDGAELDHYVCDNGAGGCCNPFHCRPVTRRENALRGETIASLNAAKTHCPRGHPLSVENLVRSKLASTGNRKCRTCDNSHPRRQPTQGRSSL